MSLDMLNGKIRVYNYELSPVGFPSQHTQQGVFIRGRDEDEEFVIERVAFDDIETENTKSDLFKVGRIRFHPDEEDEIYKKLSIEDRENIMTEKQLINFLMEDTIENIKRISNTKSITLITRMKSTLFSIERGGKIPPARITAAVIERESELISGAKRNPNSQINKILEAENKANEDDKLRNMLSEMKEEIEKLKKDKEKEVESNKAKDALLSQSQSAIEQLLKKVDELTKSEQQEETVEKKQAGRPPKK